MSEEPDDKLAQARPKLVEAKQRWAREGRLLTGANGGPGEPPDKERLPPGQHLVRDWPVLDLGILPEVETKDWRLRIDGLVENKLDWSWADFTAQPVFSDISDIHCVTAWSRFDNQWDGVSAKHILALVNPLPQARFVVFHSYDDYTANLPLADFDDDDVLIAHSWQGEKLPREHGGPMRVIVPKLYFWKSAKWVKRIEFIARDRRGFWEANGYHERGDPWKEERYS
jgi:DMSO/TMAO reductase YedYZ molybdopterin-dependent catalytic subunit